MEKYREGKNELHCVFAAQEKYMRIMQYYIM